MNDNQGPNSYGLMCLGQAASVHKTGQTVILRVSFSAKPHRRAGIILVTPLHSEWGEINLRLEFRR